MKTYKGDIKKLGMNQIFVFGSNTQGRHGKGAALFARQHCGAVYGQARGLQGRSYAICTKDLTKRVHPSISAEDIIDQINLLYEFARKNPDIQFIIPYKDTTNLNAYTSLEMAKMFNQPNLPDNVVFEESFAKLMGVI